MHARIALAIAVVLLETFPQAQEPPPAQVSVRGRPAQPGSVLEITVRGGDGLSDPKGTAFGRPLVFLAGPEPRVWRTLVGVDVATPTGPGRFRIHFASPGGRELTTTGTIDVVSRAFATRRLTVASQFVDPSPAELARIRSEAARLETIFGTVSAAERLDSFVAPLPGVPGSNFGSRSIFNGEPRAPHAGTDFRGPTGTPIPAPAAGRVVLAEDLFFTGQTVIIDHGAGLYSLLAHLSRIDVAPGQAVARGDVVGLLGATGRVTGPHLHWTVRLNGARVDPLRLVALLAPAQPGAAPGRGP